MGLCCLIAAPRTLHCWIEGQVQRTKVKGSVLLKARCRLWQLGCGDILNTALLIACHKWQHALRSIQETASLVPSFCE